MNALSALLYFLTIDQVLAGVRSRVSTFCSMRPGERVLDVCCGTGAQSLRYGQAGIASWGIDSDPGMIEFAEKRRRSLDLTSTFFMQASAMHLPFRDGAFDHASISMGLHEKEAAMRDDIVAELQRVVKKGGSLAIIDYRVPYPRGACSLAVRTIEWMAGENHFRCFGEFIRDGGLDSLLIRHRLAVEKREYAGRLPLAIVKVRNG